MDVTFRVNGKEPEFYRADNGNSEPAPYQMLSGKTAVPVQLEPREAVYVIFDKNTSVTSRAEVHTTAHLLTTVNGPWQLNFPAGWGVKHFIIVDNERGQRGKIFFWHRNVH
jgi:hypothetical protein